MSGRMLESRTGVRSLQQLVMALKKYFVGGNWKSNGSLSSNSSLVDGLNSSSFPEDDVEVVVAPTLLHLGPVQSALRVPYQVGAQNLSRTGNGAFTGEVSAEALADIGIKWVILGHSERRQLFNETDADVCEKTRRALAAGLSVIVCVGETLQERQANQTWSVVQRQLDAIVDAVQDWSKVVIAYEPIWSIGTGVVGTLEQVQEVHGLIRKWVMNHAGEQRVRVIYGGSVKPTNCNGLISQPDVDGFLVGGASLKADTFVPILNAASSL